MRRQPIRITFTALLTWGVLFLASAALGAKILYKASNHYGPLWVYQDRQTICMSFDNPPFQFDQSCRYDSTDFILSYDYTQLILGCLLLRPAPRKILMFGLGGGTLAKALQYLLPNTSLDIVEINPLIPYVASQYFNFLPGPKTAIHVVDGAEFIKTTPSSHYDIVIVDVFASDQIPPYFLTQSFIKKVHTILSVDGVLAYNLISKNTLQITNLVAPHFHKIFGHHYSFSAIPELVFMASKNDPPPISRLLKQARYLPSAFHEIGFDAKYVFSNVTLDHSPEKTYS